MIKKQRGHAAILAAIIVPALFGVFFLATDGAYSLQQKSRLDDALDVAALAVSAANSEDNDVNKQIAANYIAAYMGDIAKIKNLKVERLDCERNSECKTAVENGERRYITFKVSADYDHNLFFPNTGFGETDDTGINSDTIKISSRSTAQKYESDSIDLMYVADFSGSMNKTMENGKRRITVLKEIVKEVNDRLEKFNQNSSPENKNKVGIVPFSVVNKSKIAGKDGYCNLTQLVKRPKRTRPWSRVRMEDLDPDETVRQLFVEKGEDHCSEINTHSDRVYTWARDPEIELTDNFSSFNSKVNGFRIASGTASYQGIIRGAQLLKRGTNSRRLIIVLADGKDSKSAGFHNADMHNRLNDPKRRYCDVIRKELSKDKTPKGEDITAKIAVIGFDYDPKTNKGLRICAGANNLYSANNKDQIKSKILDLITEEIGHLK